MIDGHNVPVWLNEIACVAIVIAGISAMIIAVNILFGRKQKMALMNIVWPVTELYFGPFAVWAYWRFGRSIAPRNESADPGNKPFWQTTFGCNQGRHDFAGGIRSRHVRLDGILK